MKNKPEIPKDWTIHSFGEIFEFKNGINADKSSYGEGVKFINVMEVIYNDSITFDSIPGSVKINSNQKEAYKVKKGDVLFNRTSETQEDIGLSAVFQGEGEVVFGGFVIRGQCKEKHIDDNFKKYGFRSSYVRKQIVLRGQGGIRTNIGQSDLESVYILLPPLPEQQKIAAILSKWDEAIEAQTQLIEAKELQKKALMQKLLTGEIRFPGFEEEWE
ncbi:MAG: restriction endonuclease subunit S, partial [Flavobacteriales bacterium]|nr:restriction endonuclease subunit S [Flavobacteriales bacterium]